MTLPSITCPAPARRAWFSAATLALAAGLAACGGSSSSEPAAAPGEPFEMTLLHINDHHSRLDAETLTLRLRNAAGVREPITVDLGGFPRVAGAIEALAAERPNVIKLHAGDAITGDLYYTLDEGASDAALMNSVCFDAFVVGNHEFDNGDAGLKKFVDFLHAGSCKTPVLSANLRPRAGSALGPLGETVKPSTVITRSGQRVGIVGLTIGDKTSNSSRPDPGTTFEAEAVAAQREIDALKAQGINKIVLLTHMTYDGDKALAPRLSGVDVIVGGDSHTLLGSDNLRNFGVSPGGAYPTLATDQDGKRVCIVQAWQYSHVVGELRVKFDANGDVTECPGTPHLLIGDSLRRGNAAVTGDDAAAMRADLA
ncbi:MAG TPA: metallophosphoesterase, partial [Rubrivivax sp.]|nr:metallophosphoesterase [Rubrivivax sp.]